MASMQALSTPCNTAGGIHAVILDLGGVLVDWNPRYLYRQLFGGDVDGMERFLAEVCSPAWNERQDAGRPWNEAIDEAIAAHPDDAALIRAYYERWEEMLAGPLPATVSVLDELRRTHIRLYALTNWSQFTFPKALARYDFLQWFADIFVSGREGVIKPDPAIFRLALSRFNIEAHRTIFIDDSLKNVKAAADLGFQTIHFRDAALLRKELVDLGLLTQRMCGVRT